MVFALAILTVVVTISGFIGTIPQEKPGHEDIGKLTDSACGIEKFDSVAAIYEGRNLFAMYYFKVCYQLITSDYSF